MTPEAAGGAEQAQSGRHAVQLQVRRAPMGWDGMGEEATPRSSTAHPGPGGGQLTMYSLCSNPQHLAFAIETPPFPVLACVQGPPQPAASGPWQPWGLGAQAQGGEQDIPGVAQYWQLLGARLACGWGCCQCQCSTQGRGGSGAGAMPWTQGCVVLGLVGGRGEAKPISSGPSTSATCCLLLPLCAPSAPCRAMPHLLVRCCPADVAAHRPDGRGPAGRAAAGAARSPPHPHPCRRPPAKEHW